MDKGEEGCPGPTRGSTSVSSFKILVQFPFFDTSRKGIQLWSGNLKPNLA